MKLTLKPIKKKKCQKCKEVELFYRNGLPLSKWCKTCKLEIEAEKKVKKQSTKKFQQARYKTLKKKAWTLISEFVRKQGADSEGFNNCYTCGNRFHYKEMHCSHFHHNKLDFDLRNLKACCVKCNTYMSGNLAIYATKLALELGVEGLDQLLLDSNTISYTNDDLEAIIEKYKHVKESH